MNPRISVIIPTYNRADVLPRAMDSVFRQDHRSFELIVVNDGSTDGTEALLKKYQTHHPLRWFSTSNQGVSRARNQAVEKAQGEWLAFLDSDDEWLPQKLSRQLHLLEEQPDLSLVHGEEIWIRNGIRVNPMKKHQKKAGDVFSDALRLCCISPSTALIRKSLFLELGGFRTDFPVCEDYDLWLKVTSQQEVGFVEEPIVRKYGGHEDQLSRRYKAMDYWRVLAIDSLLERNLSAEKKRQALDEILKKAQILLNGYRKHGNLDGYDEIFSITRKRALEREKCVSQSSQVRTLNADELGL